MIPFQCNIANATGTVPVAKGNPARRCGEDPYLNRPANPANCTVGARTPIYWFQFEGNNVCRLFCQRICAVLITFALNPNDSLTSLDFQFFEDATTPPLYTDLYGWQDGAQTDIFRSVAFGTDPNSTVTSSLASTAMTSSSPPAGTTSSGSTTPTSNSPLSSQLPPNGVW